MCTIQEYFELIQKIEDQRNETVKDGNDLLEKLKENSKNNKGICNLTDVKKSEFYDNIIKYSGVKIGNFLIKIKNTVSTNKNLELIISIFEEKKFTPSGVPAKMHYAINFTKDSRFFKSPLPPNFKNGNKLTIEAVVDLIRWVQAIHRMNAFT